MNKFKVRDRVAIVPGDYDGYLVDLMSGFDEGDINGKTFDKIKDSLDNQKIWIVTAICDDGYELKLAGTRIAGPWVVDEKHLVAEKDVKKIEKQDDSGGIHIQINQRQWNIGALRDAHMMSSQLGELLTPLTPEETVVLSVAQTLLRRLENDTDDKLDHKKIWRDEICPLLAKFKVIDLRLLESDVQELCGKEGDDGSSTNS